MPPPSALVPVSIVPLHSSVLVHPVRGVSLPKLENTLQNEVPPRFLHADFFVSLAFSLPYYTHDPYIYYVYIIARWLQPNADPHIQVGPEFQASIPDLVTPGLPAGGGGGADTIPAAQQTAAAVEHSSTKGGVQ